jgi:hypothetical protein
MEGSRSQFLGAVINQSADCGLGGLLILHRITQQDRQGQAVFHLITEQLEPLSRGREGTVVEIAAQIRQGITDTGPVVRGWDQVADLSSLEPDRQTSLKIKKNLQ